MTFLSFLESDGLATHLDLCFREPVECWPLFLQRLSTSLSLTFVAAAAVRPLEITWVFCAYG